ncbi:hypothetical protein P154DRAFT_527904 [Amniculicola lignicola CBS 123094]|uniref:Uncharacterized protein n=1 Tax=Amniculicola lignicola CBS 123094 TaxID=1392246 RepID=A0A6A5VX28_9PLEO|nr:hypothetical protein P154DRAFT_527904 [Amniculicola lignicola CBS 123094]
MSKRKFRIQSASRGGEGDECKVLRYRNPSPESKVSSHVGAKIMSTLSRMERVSQSPQHLDTLSSPEPSPQMCDPQPEIEWGPDLVAFFQQWDFAREYFSSPERALSEDFQTCVGDESSFWHLELSQEQELYEDLRTCIGHQNQFWDSDSVQSKTEPLAPHSDSHQSQELHRMVAHPNRIRRRLECAEPPVHRPEALNSADPPPPYARWDPSSPSPYHRLTDPRYWKYRRRREARISAHAGCQLRQDPKPVLVRLCELVCDLPKSFRSLPERLRVRRAKQKLAWLRKHEFLCDQDRLIA